MPLRPSLTLGSRMRRKMVWKENEGVKPVRKMVGDLGERSGKYLQGELPIVSQAC